MNNIKKIIATSLMLTILTTSIVSATTNSNKRAEAIAAYKKELTTDPNYKYFMLKDINNDGIPELLINEVANNKNYALDLITYYKGKIHYLYSSEVLEKYYYSYKTKHLLTFYTYEDETSYYLYKINKDRTDVQTVAAATSENGKYYNENHKKISKSEFNKRVKSYMSNMKQLKFPYKNTKANRDKCLK